jgi:hypothetical protein
MYLIYTVKGGGVLQGTSKTDIANCLYELSFAPNDTLHDWMQDTCTRINTQFGWTIRCDTTENFIDDLSLYGLINRTL